MRTLTATTNGSNSIGLRELRQRYAVEQCVAERMTPGHVAAFVLDCFKQAARREMELLDLDCVNGRAK